MPAIRRNVKKMTYAIIFGVVIAVPVLSIAFANFDIFRRTPSTIAQPPSSIKVEQVDVVVNEGSTDIIARIRNPNPRAGVPKFTVTFVLLSSEGKEIETLQENTYLLPGSLNYIAALDVPLSTTLSRVRVETPDQPRFIAIPQSLSLPTFNSFLRSRSTRTIGPKSIEIQKGVVTNTSTLAYRKVDVTGVAFDSENNIVGIGKTFIGEFMVGEQREFTLQWPDPPSATERVIILPSTDIFNADNILQAVGDPGLLR